MGLLLPPDELVTALCEQWPGREPQIRQLTALLSPRFASNPAIVIYGSTATGKTSIITSYLERIGVPNAIIRSRECVTGRHLLEQTISDVHQSLSSNEDGNRAATRAYNTKCENLGSLAVHIQRLLADEKKFILVFDDIDQQRETPPTLIPALARLAENVPQLVVVLIMNHPPPGLLHQTGVPHLRFPPYTRAQSIQILSRQPLDIFPDPPADYDEHSHEEDKAWLWPRFCTAVWDALGESAARDVTAFRSACHKLWPAFAAPIVRGEFGTRDFSRLLVAQRRLFQEESVLLHSLVAHTGVISTTQGPRSHALPYYAKWLLIAGYLASFNPARLDETYFMKTTERKRRKKGGGTARSGGGRPGQIRKIPRHLLAASSFTLDRLLAILHAILPDDIRAGIDISKQIATLTSLRLLVRAGGLGSSDPLEPGGKFRVGLYVTWDYALALARGMDFDLADYTTD